MMKHAVCVAALPHRTRHPPPSRDGSWYVLALAVHGSVLVFLLALMADGIAGVRATFDVVQVLAATTIVLPATLGAGLVAMPASTAVGLRWALALWAVGQAACIPFASWPTLLLSGGASLAAYLLVALTVPSARPQTVCIAVEPAVLPLPQRLDPSASA